MFHDSLGSNNKIQLPRSNLICIKRPEPSLVTRFFPTFSPNKHLRNVYIFDIVFSQTFPPSILQNVVLLTCIQICIQINEKYNIYLDRRNEIRNSVINAVTFLIEGKLIEGYACIPAAFISGATALVDVRITLNKWTLTCLEKRALFQPIVSGGDDGTRECDRGPTIYANVCSRGRSDRSVAR